MLTPARADVTDTFININCVPVELAIDTPAAADVTEEFISISCVPVGLAIETPARAEVTETPRPRTCAETPTCTPAFIDEML
jgi:hypothetical protein